MGPRTGVASPDTRRKSSSSNQQQQQLAASAVIGCKPPRQSDCDTAPAQRKEGKLENEEKEKKVNVALISVSGENTNRNGATVAPPNDDDQKRDVSRCVAANDQGEDERRLERGIEEPPPVALAANSTSPSDVITAEHGVESEVITANGQPPVCSTRQQSDSVPAAGDAQRSWYLAHSDDTCARVLDEQQLDSTAFDSTPSDDYDDVTDTDTCSQDDVITIPIDDNYFTVTPCERDSSRSGDNYSLRGSGGERVGGDGSDDCVSDNSNNVDVERRICEIAAELSELDTRRAAHEYSSANSTVECCLVVEDINDKLVRLEKTCDRLTRENASLSDLLAAKKVECVETKQRYKALVQDLEDDVSRLKMEKCRLLDRLQLPESERAALTAEENALSELRRKLEETEDRLETARTENTELRQDLRDAELAMLELHDQFQAEESLELRELQRELESTSRDCRLLHFKVS